jgi:hypothetical protein
MKNTWHHIMTLERLNAYYIDYTQPNSFLKKIISPLSNNISNATFLEKIRQTWPVVSKKTFQVLMHIIHKDLGAIDKSDFLTQYFYVLKEPKPNILGSNHELSIRHCEFDNLLDPIYLGSTMSWAQDIVYLTSCQT